MKVLFMGTPDFARESLEAIYNNQYEIVGVVTNPDRPQGRGMKLVGSPVKEFSIEKNLRIFQPDKVKNNVQFIQQLKELKPDVICVVAYGKILPKEILEIAPLGCINVHGSILPKYRGAAPIQWAVLNGDKETGITTMYMSEKLDAGDIILVKKTEVGENETTGELWDRLSKLGAETLIETLKKIEEGSAKNVPQGENYSLSPMLNREMSKIYWKIKSANEIKNLVRGLNPIMGAITFYEEKKIKFWKVRAWKEQEFMDKFLVSIEGTAGTVLLANDKQGLFIKTNDGIIEVLEIQGENAKRMGICDFLRGNRVEVGKVLGV